MLTPRSPGHHTGADRLASMQICVASLTGELHLAGASPTLQRQIGERLGAYIMTAPAGFSPPAFELAVTFLAERPRPPDSRGTFIRPVVDTTAGTVTIKRWDFEAHLERGAGGWHGQALCLDSAFTFESLCRVVWSALLPRWGGALFHGCGIALPGTGRAILAAGPSGAGKTTLARKVPEARDVLSDEVVVVNRAASGWRLESTPFFGEFPPVNLAPRRFPLAGVAFLEQRPDLAATSLPAAEAIFRAMGCLMSWEQNEEGVARLLDLVVAMAAEVPLFRCASRVDSSFTQIMEVVTPLLVIDRDAA